VYRLVRPLLFALPPATAHAAGMVALGPLEHVGLLRAALSGIFRPNPRLRVEAMGLVFPSPIGVAGGFDKNGTRARALAALGFGFVEVGTLTARPQAANPAPNLFRLPRDRALVNRLGFPNEGAEIVCARLAARRPFAVPLGVSIGKSRDVPIEEATDDYLASFRAARAAGDFVVVNVSSPNTKDLRAMQAAEIARPLLRALQDANDTKVPLLVKIAPDLADDAVDAMCEVARDVGLAGIVATNTTIARSGLATSKRRVEKIGAGGLSGPPLRGRALEVVRRVRAKLGEGMTVIGAGGVETGAHARALLDAGANLVQLYTGFIYRGPLTAWHVGREL
jgi:dihydroorotate dehydrogenase